MMAGVQCPIMFYNLGQIYMKWLQFIFDINICILLLLWENLMLASRSDSLTKFVQSKYTQKKKLILALPIIAVFGTPYIFVQN